MAQAKKQTLKQPMKQAIKQLTRELAVGVTKQQGSTLKSKWLMLHVRNSHNSLVQHTLHFRSDHQYAP
jgi:hypothetical protein